MKRWIKSLFASATPRPAATGPKLGVEQLDRRDLPSVVWSESAMLATGDGSNDLVTVTRDTKGTTSPYDDTLTVRRDYGSYGDPATNLFSPQTESKTLPIYWPGTTVQLVRSVTASLGNGWNDFTNSSNMPSTATGGNDKDVFSGGSGQDIFSGRGGNDLLIGNKGNDRLYGGDGADQLFGGEGTDGLYGGYGTDFLAGGTGSDRYLVTQNPDVIFVAEAIDSVLAFNNTTGADAGSEHFTGASWTQGEIEQVDEALATVHEAANSPVFLRHNGGDMKFYRAGIEQSDPNGAWRKGSHVLAWNDDNGKITFDDYTFSASAARVHEVALHELGHNFEDEDPVGLWGAFQDLSGWTRMQDATQAQLNGLVLYGTYRVSGDGKWIYLASQQQFTRDYARKSPREDFAECFSMYWMHKMDEVPTMATRSYEDMLAKMDFMSIFVGKVVTQG